MSELFTQNYSDKPLFHTDTDLSESLHNQVDEASNGEELLDNTEKQAESLLSNDDYVSETKNSISDDSDDAAESLSPPAEGNRKYITGTNTPRASRSNAYYELLCKQQTNGYRSPAMRGTTAAAHGITSASGLVSYQEDFATDAAQDVGVHGAATELIMQETFLGTAAEDVGILGSYAVKGIKDVQDGTRTAEEVLRTGGDVLRMELGSSAVQIGSAGARTALHYAESFSTSADDFADRAPGIISNTSFQAGHSVIRVARFFAHPVKAIMLNVKSKLQTCLLYFYFLGGTLIIEFNNDEILFLEGETGMVGIIKVAYENKMLFIATQNNEEIVQFLEKDDLIAVSNFKKDKRAIRSQAYLTREENSPLVILNKEHPSTKRLETVLSVGDRVCLNCNITPGTHPEQDVLCSCDSLSGLEISKTETGIKLNQYFDKYTIEKF